MANDRTIAEAIEWRLRLRDDRVEDWEAFMLWLEGDPARGAAYDEIALGEDDTDMALAAMPGPAANDDDRSGWPRRRWIGGAVAAAAAVLIGIAAIPSLTSGDQLHSISTRQGEKRIIALGDGNSIMLNGSSRLTLRKDDSRYASLDAGEAHFSIRHDANRPFELSVGDVRIRDAGTIFNVIRDTGKLRVAVAEGRVIFDPVGDPVELAAGQSLHQTSGRRRQLGSINPADVGGWRNGKLAYRDAPLVDVASDLSRLMGTKVAVDTSIADRPFTGVIRVDRDRDTFFRRLGLLLDVDAHRNAHGWTLAPRASAGR